MQSRMVVFLLAVKMALLVPSATATLGVVATHVEAAGESAPVLKVPHAPVSAPAAAAAPAQRIQAVGAPQLGHATAQAQARDEAIDAHAHADAAHIWGKGLFTDIVVPLDLTARGDGAAIMQADAQKLAHAQRRSEAAFSPSERAPPLGDAIHYAAPPATSDDITDRGAATPPKPSHSETSGSPPHVATRGPIAPASGPAAIAAPLVVAAATGAAFLALLAALYARLRGASALASDKRARLLAALHGAPGLNIADAARALDCDASTARHHLRTLVREGFAVDHAGRYFASGDVPAAKRDAHLAANDSSRVLDAVRATPGASKQQIADALDCARATVSWHLKRLQQAGLVRTERDGKCVRLYPAP